MAEEPQLCPHCGHTNEHWDEFCLSVVGVSPAQRMRADSVASCESSRS